jgi:hypothetical protein
MRRQLGLLSFVAATIACGGGVSLPSDGDAAVDGAVADGQPTPGDGGPGTMTIEKLGSVSRTEKLDLLLVVDNSISMADKQSELGRRVPEMIRTITATDGFSDVHVGVITSSLGSYGTSVCSPESTKKPHDDDRAHLLPRSIGEYQAVGSGFRAGPAGPQPSPCPGGVVAVSPLTWAFGGGGSAAAAEDLEVATSCVIQSAKDEGCGYEATWEAAYKFLIDPAPPARESVACTSGAGGDNCGSNDVVVEGRDEALLAQRRAFLRDDSVLAVVVLSDENDASLKPAGKNWLPWALGPAKMPRGWAGCANVPDDVEPNDNNELRAKYGCASCIIDKNDPNCGRAWPDSRTTGPNVDVDGRNVRAFQQVQRFGFNFLWPRERYVDGFSKGIVLGRDGLPAPNPVFRGGRSRDKILVAGLIGVPTSLVANADGTPKALSAADWEKIVGPVGTRDPHMIESIAPRAGLPKYAGDPRIDPVHGGEREIADGSDLQYACIARRSETRPTDDCSGSNATKNPLCDPATNSQPRLKAYPGLRHLRILRDLGASGLVGSICAEDYRPALASVAMRLREMSAPSCTRATLPTDPAGRVSCAIIQTIPAPGDRTCAQIGKGLCTPGEPPCRKVGDPSQPPTSIEEAVADLKIPYAGGEAARPIVEKGNAYVVDARGVRALVCEVEQLTDETQANVCKNDLAFEIDPAQGGGFCWSTNAAVIGDRCRASGANGRLRFAGGAIGPGREAWAICRR